ncbi:MAG TPA: RNA polymerase sigma factor [Vicinamibacterales bacterium]
MPHDLHPELPDETLVARIADGNVEALGTLFRRRQQNVYRFALHLTGSASLADDVTQDVFVTVIREAAKFEAGRAPVSAWLCGIARNFVRRRLAIERGTTAVDVDEGVEASLHAATPDPLDALTSAESIEALRRAVLSLPLRYREALVLCDLHEMSYVDAAAALSCPVGTVRSRLNRARALLTEKMLAEQRRKASPLRGMEGVTKCLA